MEFYNYIRFFTVYLVFCMLLLNIQLGLSVGVIQTLMVTVFYVLFLSIGYLKKYKNWLDILSFLIPLSLFFFIPDWFLVSQLNILEFSKYSTFTIGNVPIYLIGMWTISLFLMTYNSISFFEKYRNNIFRYSFLIGISIFIYILSDEMLWQLSVWQYKNVKTISHTPVFMVLPNMFLGFYTYYGYQKAKFKPFYHKLLLAFSVMLIRFVLILVSYYLVEKLF